MQPTVLGIPFHPWPRPIPSLTYFMKPIACLECATDNDCGVDDADDEYVNETDQEEEEEDPLPTSRSLHVKHQLETGRCN